MVKSDKLVKYQNQSGEDDGNCDHLTDGREQKQEEIVHQSTSCSSSSNLKVKFKMNIMFYGRLDIEL